MQHADRDRPPITIRPAAWPSDEATAIGLVRRYAAHLQTNMDAPIALSEEDLDLVHLAQAWSEPHGVLLLAFLGERPAGCIAVKVLANPSGCFELKRLWVEYDAQGRGLGRLLVQAAIAWASARSANALLLDTVPVAMPQAVALYRSLGFEETERYNSNPVQDLQFMQLRLR